MKVTRSFWFGLGSGLILSAMLMMVLSPLHGQAVVSGASPQADTGVKQEPLNPTVPVKPSETTQPLQEVKPPVNQSTTSIERQFVIPKGASAERIADLLLAQGFITDKEAFLVGAHHLGVESRFSAGTFNLSAGLSPEELIHRLIKK